MKIYLSALLSLSLFLTACSTVQQTPAEKYKNQSAERLFAQGEKAIADGEYHNALEHFDALDALYPYGPQAEQALLDKIYAYYKADDATSAVAAADRFIHLYPRSQQVDYAYYMRGIADFAVGRSWFQRYLHTDLSQRDLTPVRQAFADFYELIQRFPQSRYTPDAKQRMIYLRNLLAQNELNIAKFYFNRDAYIAAANRASMVLLHYQETPAVNQALQILIQSYTKLGLTEPAAKAKMVWQYNFRDKLNELP